MCRSAHSSSSSAAAASAAARQAARGEPVGDPAHVPGEELPAPAGCRPRRRPAAGRSPPAARRATSRLNAERSPWVRPCRASPSSASASWPHRSASSSGSGRSWASRGAARPSGCRRTPAAARCRPAAPGRARPRRGRQSRVSAANSACAHWPDEQVAAERRAGGHRPHLAGPAHPAALEVAGVAVEHPVLGAAVALGGEQHAPPGARARRARGGGRRPPCRS